MDDFGIGAGVLGAYHSICRAMRQSGRTTRMIKTVKKNDRVVVTDQAMGKWLERKFQEKGKSLDWVACDPKNVVRLLQMAQPKGRLHFDHTWLEIYYENDIRASIHSIRTLQDRLSGKYDHDMVSEESRNMQSRFRR